MKPTIEQVKTLLEAHKDDLPSRGGYECDLHYAELENGVLVTLEPEWCSRSGENDQHAYVVGVSEDGTLTVHLGVDTRHGPDSPAFFNYEEEPAPKTLTVAELVAEWEDWY